MSYAFTKKVRFNQLDEGDVFTFRKNGKIVDDGDELLRHDHEYFNKKNGRYVCDANVLSYGGGWFKINNTRCWVWTTVDGGK